MAPRRNEQRNGENDTYRFQRRHNGQRDHAQQPIMQTSRMQNRLPAPVDNQS